MWQFILPALSIANGMHQYNAAKKAANQAKIAGNENAELAELEGEERVRRYEIEQKRLRGAQHVAYAKAGVRMEGTPLTVLAEAATHAEQEIAFMREQTARTAKARRAGANAQADSLKSQGKSLLIGGLGQAAKYGYDNNWWRT